MKVYQHHFKDEWLAWAMSSKKYATKAIFTVEALLLEEEDGYYLKTMAKKSVPSSYQAKFDIQKN